MLFECEFVSLKNKWFSHFPVLDIAVSCTAYFGFGFPLINFCDAFLWWIWIHSWLLSLYYTIRFRLSHSN